MEVKIQIQTEPAAEKIQLAAINNDVTDGSYHDLSRLLAACQNNSVEIMREVLRVKPGVVWSKLNGEGDRAIHVACDREHIAILKVLLTEVPGLCYLKDKRGDFPLHTASKMGKVQVIQTILEACPDCLDGQLVTALHLSVIHDKADAFAVLMAKTLSYKPDILHFKDSEGNNVLHLATQHKRYKILELLLEDNDRKGPLVRIHSKNSKGLTALEIHSHRYEEPNDEKIFLLLRNAAKLSNQSIMPNSTSVQADKQALTTTETLVLTFSSLIAGSAYTSIFNLDKVNHVRYEGVGIRGILFHPSQLPNIFYTFVFITIAFTVSLAGVVISIWSVITGWSFCYLTMPLFGLCAFFISYAIMMHDKMPRFIVTLIPHAVEVTGFSLVWLYSQALTILFLSVIWIGAKLCFCVSSKAKSVQARG
ncbi:Ankyrin repeat-containing protein [Actinidia chinensis var. chinensis]|uniref:Ankyrin repeat-containing protein n=1 Tax=Actinidia chinensis var. chinensis TaxID=1590841 RepID=A0A2R6RAH1_ACTCC|nr:Ankyrin repeat-containing protein [Actinidia chinensis var. chinensis]